MINVSSNGINVSVAELITLRQHAKYLSHDTKQAAKVLPGQRLTEIRGRGIEFDSTREYQSGDDIRNMAWRVTARTLKPHVKVYQEDKERPVWMCLDLSPSLYFGTRMQFKSVLAIQMATLLGWAFRQAGEKVGSLIVDQDGFQIFKPQLSEASFLHVLNAFSLSSHKKLKASAEPYLKSLLTKLSEVARTGQPLYLFSDFHGWDTEIERQISLLAHRCQLHLKFIYDPFEEVAPPPHAYLLTDGKQKVLFDTQLKTVRRRYEDSFKQKKIAIENFAKQRQIDLTFHSTNLEAVAKVSS